jgi:hypothetical protein
MYVTYMYASLDGLCQLKFMGESKETG